MPNNVNVFGKLERQAIKRLKIPPTCYLPPVWEIIINSEINQEILEKQVQFMSTQDPIPPAPRAIVEYMKNRINLVKSLIDEGKLNSELGNAAINHFEAHIKDTRTNL